jgi:hypothetical protein
MFTIKEGVYNFFKTEKISIKKLQKKKIIFTIKGGCLE